MSDGLRFVILSGPDGDGMPPGRSGAERRFAKRVRVEVPGLFEVTGKIHQVRYTDISRTGFSVLVPGEPPVGASIHFFIAGNVDGAGEIMNVNHQGTKSKVGCRVSPELYGRMDDLVRFMLETESGGCVSRSACGKGLSIEGRLGVAQWRDVANARDVRSISVQGVTSIDSAGIGLLLAKLNEGARLEGCNSQLAEYMRTINACQRCDPECRRCGGGESAYVVCGEAIGSGAGATNIL